MGYVLIFIHYSGIIVTTKIGKTIFHVLAITLYSNINFMVAVEGIAPPLRSPNECNPYRAFVTWQGE